MAMTKEEKASTVDKLERLNSNMLDIANAAKELVGICKGFNERLTKLESQGLTDVFNMDEMLQALIGKECYVGVGDHDHDGPLEHRAEQMHPYTVGNYALDPDRIGYFECSDGEHYIIHYFNTAEEAQAERDSRGGNLSDIEE